VSLFCTNVDLDMICLLGHWKSDTMFQYLFVQAWSLVNHLPSACSAMDGNFDLLPGTPVNH